MLLSSPHPPAETFPDYRFMTCTFPISISTPKASLGGSLTRKLITPVPACISHRGDSTPKPKEGVMKRLVVLVGFAVIAVMVRVDCAIAETKGAEEKITQTKEDQTKKIQETLRSVSMKQALLDPKGLDMHWTCGGRSGWSRVSFKEDDKKIVADITVVEVENIDINRPENFGPERCTTENKLTETGLIFNGCSPAMHDIPLAYTPESKIIVFKASGPDCPKVELSPR